MSTVYISTADNPYSPEKDYLAWHNYDMQKGYYSAEYLNRVYEKNLELKKKDSKASNNKIDYSDIDEEVLEDSIDEIINLQNELNKQLNDEESEKFKISYVKLESTT